MEIFDQHYFFVNKALLRSTGLWPYESRRRKFCIRTFVNLILGVCVIFPQVRHGYSLPLRIDGIISNGNVRMQL